MRRFLLFPLLALALGGLACGGEKRPFPAGSNILLITIDTLRADHLSAYGYARETSPVIDALAAEGLRFDQTAVQWPKTGPSFASIFTSTYPKDNGIVRQVGIPLPQEFLTLAEVLQKRGYSTAAVVANGAVGSEFNFNQGFDTYVESWKLDKKRHPGLDPVGAEVVNRLAKEVFAGLDPEKPWFVWLHYLDPHFPYTPPGEWSDKFQGDEHWDGEVRIPIHMESARRQMVGIGRTQVLDERDELAFYEARYDAEIAYADHKIGELLDHLRADGRLDETLIALTADHGESLGDHHYFFDHGRFGFETCTRVPLIFHYPGVIPPRVDPMPVELLDLTPTLLEVAGGELPGGAFMQGRTLMPRLLGGTPSAGTVAFTEAGYATGGQWQKIVRDERFKLIHAPKREENRWIGGVDVPYALYDLQADPNETTNVAEQHPRELARLQTLLQQWNEAEEFPVLVDAASDGEVGEMDAETREQLKALGYID